MFTSALAFALALLKAIPAIVSLLSQIGKHLKELDVEHNEKTANERFTIKKQATADIIAAANSTVTDKLSEGQQSSGNTPETKQLSTDKSSTP